MGSVTGSALTHRSQTDTEPAVSTVMISGSDHTGRDFNQHRKKILKGSYDAISSVSFSLECYKLFVHR